MDINVEIELINQQDNQVIIELPIGSVVEVDESGSQNVALAQRYRFIVPPRSKVRKQVTGVCLNRNLSPPNCVPGMITPFRFDSPTINQDDVWNRVSDPTSH